MIGRHLYIFLHLRLKNIIIRGHYNREVIRKKASRSTCNVESHQDTFLSFFSTHTDFNNSKNFVYTYNSVLGSSKQITLVLNFVLGLCLWLIFFKLLQKNWTVKKKCSLIFSYRETDHQCVLKFSRLHRKILFKYNQGRHYKNWEISWKSTQNDEWLKVRANHRDRD